MSASSSRQASIVEGHLSLLDSWSITYWFDATKGRFGRRPQELADVKVIVFNPLIVFPTRSDKRSPALLVHVLFPFLDTLSLVLPDGPDGIPIDSTGTVSTNRRLEADHVALYLDDGTMSPAQKEVATQEALLAHRKLRLRFARTILPRRLVEWAGELYAADLDIWADIERHALAWDRRLEARVWFDRVYGRDIWSQIGPRLASDNLASSVFHSVRMGGDAFDPKLHPSTFQPAIRRVFHYVGGDDRYRWEVSDGDWLTIKDRLRATGEHFFPAPASSAPLVALVLTVVRFPCALRCMAPRRPG